MAQGQIHVCVHLLTTPVLKILEGQRQEDECDFLKVSLTISSAGNPIKSR